MFRIGEFSRIVQLSVRVLRHYDEIGLLVPARVDPSSGFRYYSGAQLADAHRIIALKEMGLSLEQVRRLTAERVSADELVGMLRMEAARAEQARADAERRLQRLRHQLAQLDGSGTMTDIHIIEKSIPAMPLLACRTILPDLTAAAALVNELLTVRATRLRYDGPLLALAHDAFLDIENLDIEVGFPVSTPTTLTLDSGRHLTQHLLPAVERMLSIVGVGSPEETHRRCHAALGAWLTRYGCHLAGPGRELIHADDPDDGDTTTVEIQYPVASTELDDMKYANPIHLDIPAGYG